MKDAATARHELQQLAVKSNATPTNSNPRKRRLTIRRAAAILDLEAKEQKMSTTLTLSATQAAYTVPFDESVLAEGPVFLVLGPEDFALMKPGSVLVAVTTTPAWTPLFGMAAAVVTDIGGPLSHSSIVAREYGIPAVMATGSATRKIHSGQMITVDGNAGTVTVRS